jgi:hypothetical protein
MKDVELQTGKSEADFKTIEIGATAEADQVCSPP